MCDRKKIEEDEILRAVALELMYDNPQKWHYSEGATALEIARRQGIKLDIVKKKLKILKEAGLVRTIDLNPKRWKFDEYNFNQMDIEDPIYFLITRYDDDDYQKFYF